MITGKASELLFVYVNNIRDWNIKVDIHVGKVKHKNTILKY